MTFVTIRLIIEGHSGKDSYDMLVSYGTKETTPFTVGQDGYYRRDLIVGLLIKKWETVKYSADLKGKRSLIPSKR